MANSGSMFLFEVVVEKLISFINCKTFLIKGQFADVFFIEFGDSNKTLISVPRKKKLKRKSVRVIKSPSREANQAKVLCQSIFLISGVEKLKANMTDFPIELSLWDITNPKKKSGSTQIFWNQKFIDYLNKLMTNIKKAPAPVTIAGDYNVFDETTSKRMATISLKIKLSHINHNIIENPFNLKDKKHHAAQNPRRDDKFHQNVKSRKIVKVTEASDEIYKCIDPVAMEEIKDDKRDIPLQRISKSLLDIEKSELQPEKVNDLIRVKSKSSTIIKTPPHYNPLSYIFGGDGQSFGNKVYCVGYFTVQNDSTGGPSESPENKPRYKIQICDTECPAKKADGEPDSLTHLSINLPAQAKNLITVKKCDAIDCNAKRHREPPPKADDRILIDLGRPRYAQKIEEVEGGIDAKLKNADDPCFCTCECRFGFTKRTTYCEVCGGYEKVGEEVVGKHGQLPFPCPIFHKLVDRTKSRTMSTSGSDIKRNMKSGSKTDRQNEPDKLNKKEKTKKNDDRFKFNYGYEGKPPHIGHSQCAMPCTGTLGAVPKNMGWLWTAENVPGLKFRPLWRPGATNKHVVRLLRMAKNPGEVTKKRRREQKTKRSLVRPLLMVHKKDGEYTVTMETMKTFSKPRAINQYPYEDKKHITYTIGRSEAENIERQKKKEREQRRLERMQRNFIQSAFRDLCREICLKTYQQALGILPTTESPDCPCFPAHPGATQANLDVSCSCSEDQSSIGSDTDSDEWIVEFTPPSALFDPKNKSKKIIKADNSSQYTYLDYRVKLTDSYGNPVPRFFKGQDGRQLCSDLGGFWSPDHKWLEINVDGFVAPDGRWAPHSFLGPNGEQIEAEGGKFLASNGKWLVIGIDGYIDTQNKWRAYARPRQSPQGAKKVRAKKNKGGAGDKNKAKLESSKPSEGTFSCLGDASLKYLSEMGIMGHGPDKRLLLEALKKMIAQGENVKIPQRPLVPPAPISKNKKTSPIHSPDVYDARNTKCIHPTPSSKGVVAVNDDGDKVYFRLKDPKNKRPIQRLHDLNCRGISLSSFHVPCFHSFINSEMMKKQLQERILASNQQSKSVGTEAYFANTLAYPGNLRPTT